MSRSAFSRPESVSETYSERRFPSFCRRRISPAFSMRSRMLPTVAGSISQRAAIVFWSASGQPLRKSSTLGWPAVRPILLTSPSTRREKTALVFMNR